MSFCPLIRMPGTSLGPCMLVRRSYASSVVQRYKWTSPKETGRIRIGRQNNSGSEPEFFEVVVPTRIGVRARFRRAPPTLFWFAWPNLALNVSYHSALHRSTAPHSYETPDPKMLRVPTSIRVELARIEIGRASC